MKKLFTKFFNGENKANGPEVKMEDRRDYSKFEFEALVIVKSGNCDEIFDANTDEAKRIAMVNIMNNKKHTVLLVEKGIDTETLLNLHQSKAIIGYQWRVDLALPKDFMCKVLLPTHNNNHYRYTTSSKISTKDILGFSPHSFSGPKLIKSEGEKYCNLGNSEEARNYQDNLTADSEISVEKIYQFADDKLKLNLFDDSNFQITRLGGSRGITE